LLRASHCLLFILLVVAVCVAELSDEPLTYQVHVVPNQDGENNFGTLGFVVDTRWMCC
jgi:hypothetical protein